VRPHGRRNLGQFFLGVLGTLFVLFILSMFCFGPQILEWLERMPAEPGEA
jgi:hypothetical protein